MQKYLNKIISLGLLANATSTEQINIIYDELMQENTDILKETHKFFEKDGIYYNIYNANIVNIQKDLSVLNITIKAKVCKNGEDSQEKPICLKIDVKGNEKIELGVDDKIKSVIVHNNQIGFIYVKKDEINYQSNIINFRNIELKDNICFSRLMRRKTI